MHLVYKMSFVWRMVVILGAVGTQACGDCAGVGLSRLGPTEQTIHVGESFVAFYEEGGSCHEAFAPVPNRVTWSSAETRIVAVDSHRQGHGQADRRRSRRSKCGR